MSIKNKHLIINQLFIFKLFFMKKISIIILSLMLLLGGVSMVSCGGVDSKLKTVVEEFNKTTPMDVGPGIRIEKMEIPSSKTIKCIATFTTMTKDQINVEQIEPMLKPAMISALKSDPNFKVFVDNKVSVIYVFNDKNGDNIFEINLKPEDYK